MELGADKNCVEDDGDTPLLLACCEPAKGKGYEIAQILLNAGADVEGTNEKGHSPLYWACTQCKTRKAVDPYELVGLLLDHGANPNRSWWLLAELVCTELVLTY
jgi:hypothetical protein